MFTHKTTAGDVLRGMVAGAIGGAVATWAMGFLMPREQVPEQPKLEESSKAAELQQQASSGGGEQPTTKVAAVISRKLFDHELSEGEKQIAGPAVHYGFGTAVGALYGGLAEVWPNAKIGLGMGYGMALWALGGEAAVPALRLAPPPTASPLETHADTLSAHIAYGLTLDIVRRVAKGVL